MNEIEFYLKETDQKIIRLWNACHSAEAIADTLDIDVEYVAAVIDEPSNYYRRIINERTNTSIGNP